MGQNLSYSKLTSKEVLPKTGQEVATILHMLNQYAHAYEYLKHKTESIVN